MLLWFCYGMCVMGRVFRVLELSYGVCVMTSVRILRVVLCCLWYEQSVQGINVCYGVCVIVMVTVFGL